MTHDPHDDPISLNVFCEGLTLNWATELLLDSTDARAQTNRRTNPVGYYKALSKFVAAFLFADYISFDQKVLDSGGIIPWGHAMERMGHSDIWLPLSPLSGSSPYELVLRRDEACMQALDSTIDLLDRAWSLEAPDYPSWHAHIVREAVLYTDVVTEMDNLTCPLWQYRFGNSQRDYFVTEDTEPFVRQFLDRIQGTVAFNKAVEFLRTSTSGPVPAGFPDRILREFVARNYFAHILIHVVNERGVDINYRLIHPVNGTYCMNDQLLSDTRQNIVLAKLDHPASSVESRERFLDACLPDVMAWVLAKAIQGRRKDERTLLEPAARALIDIRSHPLVKRVRVLWRQCRFEDTDDSRKDLEAHGRELERSRDAYDVCAWNSVAVARDGSLRLPLPAILQTAKDVGRVLYPRGQWALRMAHGTSKGSRSRMMSLLTEAFPNTFLKLPHDTGSKLFPTLHD